MAPVSIDDLIASLKGNGIGQEASDLAAVKAHLSQTLGPVATQNGYTPTHTSNTPQGTPVSPHPPMGAPWDTRSARRHRSQSRGFDMAIDEADEPVAESSTSVGGMDRERWRSQQRKGMHSPQDSFAAHRGHAHPVFPPMSPISGTTAPPLSPPASPTRTTYPHHQPMPIPPSSYAHHPHEGGYAATSDPFLQQAQAAQHYGQFFPQSPPMEACPPAVPVMGGWNPAWPAGYAQPVQARDDGRR